MANNLVKLLDFRYQYKHRTSNWYIDIISNDRNALH